MAYFYPSIEIYSAISTWKSLSFFIWLKKKKHPNKQNVIFNCLDISRNFLKQQVDLLEMISGYTDYWIYSFFVNLLKN